MGSFQGPGRPFADAALRCDRVTHVISRTRPSRFSACNIEKLGMGLGTRLGKPHRIMLKSKVTVDVSSILSYITKQWHTLKVKMFKGLLIQYVIKPSIII